MKCMKWAVVGSLLFATCRGTHPALPNELLDDTAAVVLEDMEVAFGSAVSSNEPSLSSTENKFDHIVFPHAPTPQLSEETTPEPTTQEPTPAPTTEEPEIDPNLPVGTSCPHPRVRRSWDSYTAAEKALYQRALVLAMERGYHQKFVQLHIEFGSEMEAHRNCMFIYWHRRYLLGYENMLRSLGPEFQCVTIPVWDHLYATAKRQTGECRSIHSCSQIYQDLGGAVIGVRKSVQVYNITISPPSRGLCITNGVCGHFCGSNPEGCAGCIVRGSPTVDYPADAYMSSVYSQLFSSRTWWRFASAVERGVHNTVHGWVGGTMAYFQSPIDPLFYTHHAFVDALQAIYLKCAFNLESIAQPLTESQKRSWTLWTNCRRRDQGYFYRSTPIRMQLEDEHGVWVDVTTPGNMLYPFFKDLPTTFGDYVDARDLGPYSYTYSFQEDSNLHDLMNQCTAAARTGSVRPSLLAEEANVAAEGNEEQFYWGTLTKAWRHRRKVSDKVHRWSVVMYEAALANGYTRNAAREMLETITCIHKHECISPVQDYTEEFRRNFHVSGHSRCFILVKMVENGEKIIGIPGWREITSKFLPCTLKSSFSEEVAEQ